MRRMISWKRLLVVVGILLLLGGGTYAVHKVQVRRQASSLKERAEQVAATAEADPKQLAEALDLYEQYLRFRPTDEAAYLKYVNLVLLRAKNAHRHTEQAADVVEGFLRRFPDHPDERRKLIELYIKLGRLNTAKQHIQTMFDSPKGDYKQDVDLLERAAAVEIGTGDVVKGVEHLKNAIDTKNASVRTYELILATLHAHPPTQASGIQIGTYIGKLKNPPFDKNVSARVLAARYLRLTQPGSTNPARDELTEIAKLPGATDNTDYLLALAELDLDDAKGTPDQIKQKLADAQKHLEKAFGIAPKDTRIGFLLADVLRRQNDFAKATDVLLKTAAALGEPNDAYLFVVDRLLDHGERVKTAELTDRLAGDVSLQVIVKYFRGRLAVLAGDWQKARELLEEVLPKLERLAEYHKKAATGLAMCHESKRLDNPDRQLMYSNAALADDRLFVPAMACKADALVRLGQFREALPLLTTLVYRYKIDTFRPTLARLELLATLSQPENARSWEAFDTSLGPAETRTPELKHLEAEGLAARGDVDNATKILTALTTADPKNTAALVTLGRLRDGGRPETALAAIEEAEKQVGDVVELRLAKARVMVTRPKKPTPNDLRALGANADKFPEPDRHRLWFGLGEAATRVTQTTADPAAAGEMRAVAIECFRNAARIEKFDLQSRAALIDLGLDGGLNDVVQDALDQIIKVEGPDGPMANLAAVAIGLHNLSPEEKDKEARAAEIKKLREKANKARAARPSWSRVYFAIGKLDELEGLNDLALTAYLEAIKLGDRQEYVVRQAVRLYRERKQDNQAVALLNALSTEGPLPDDLERYRATINLLNKNVPKRERATIDRWYPANSKDYRVQLFRGVLLAAMGEDADALDALYKAVELGDNVPETWVTLVTHLVRKQMLDEAKKAVAQAEKKFQAAQPPTERARADLLMAIAGCHELLGDRPAAGERYRQARDAAPKELNPNRQYILFLQRSGNKPEADKLLRQLIQSPAQDQARWARRHLALTLIVGPNGYAQRAAAMKLIDENLAAAPTDPEDVKAKAVVQTVDPVTRDEGMKALVEFARWNDLTPDEYYLLARLYFDVGKTDVSIPYFEAAARPRPGLTADHIAGLVRVYLARKLMRPAADALDRLKTTFPASWEAAAEEARMLSQRAADAEREKKPAEANKFREQALDRVLKFPGADAPAFIAGRSGPLLDDLGSSSPGFAAATAAAEDLYRKHLAQVKDEGAHLPLAIFLINKQRTAEAIALARQYEGRCSVVVTGRILTGAVRAKNPGPDVERQVEDWLGGKLKEYQGKPEFAALLGCRAELLDAQGKYDDAIAEYRKAIGVQKSDLLVNNLCMLLALHRRSDVNEAIRLMTDLIEIRGPAPAYLDTRAVCYLVSSRPEDAVNDLELALIQRLRPAQLFHLAWAYSLMTDKRVQSLPTLVRAKDASPDKKLEDELHPLEHPKLKELENLAKQPPK